ncbi:MAG: IBR domain-containing protein [Oligoflexia bacterium]|nr:IBR domain-containing protein [Oligoflexia bacterium]
MNTKSAKSTKKTKSFLHCWIFLLLFSTLAFGTQEPEEKKIPFGLSKEIAYKIVPELAKNSVNLITTWQQLQTYISEIMNRKKSNQINILDGEQELKVLNRINFLSRSTKKNILLFEDIIKNEERETRNADTFEEYIKSLNLSIMSLYNLADDPIAKAADPSKYVDNKLQLLSQTFDPGKFKGEALAIYKKLFSEEVLFADYLVKILSAENNSALALREKFMAAVASVSRATLNQTSDASNMMKVLFAEIIPAAVQKIKVAVDSKLLTEIEGITTSKELLGQIEKKKLSVEEVIEHFTSILSLCSQDQQCKSIWEKSFVKTLANVIPLTKSCNQLLEILKSLKSKSNSNSLSEEIKKVFSSLPVKYFEDIEISSPEEIRSLKKEITFSGDRLEKIKERELALYNQWALKKIGHYLKEEIGKSTDKSSDHSLEKELISMVESLNSLKDITFSKGSCVSCLGDEEEVITRKCCGVKICKSCYSSYAKEQIQQGNCLKCFNPSCNHLIPLDELTSICSSKEEYRGYEKAHLQSLLTKIGSYLRKDSNYYKCPTNNCHMHFKDPTQFSGCENLKGSFTCPCCEIASCFKCKGAHNDKISCQEYQKQKMLEGSSDSLLRSLMRDPYYYTRPCPTVNCLGSLSKTDACNHVTCAVCKEKKDLIGGNSSLAVNYDVKPAEYSSPRIYRVPGDLNMITGEIYTKYTKLTDGHADQIIDEKHPYWNKLTDVLKAEMTNRKKILEEQIKSEKLKLDASDLRMRLFKENKDIMWDFEK